MWLGVIASFFLCESPRWLMLVDRHDDAVKTLVRLRGLPADHARVQRELAEIQGSIQLERERYGCDTHNGIVSIVKETFTVPSSLRRVQQTLVSYGLAQLSGANSVTSYFIPILTLMGVGGGTTRNLFLSGMYGLSKLFFALIASFFFIDALGRRRSLFVGITFQMLSDLYIGIYIKYKQEGDASAASSQAAIGLVFVHVFGYAVGKSEDQTPYIVLLPNSWGYRSLCLAVCVWRRALAQQAQILRWGHVAVLSLVVHICHDLRHTIPP